MAFFQSAKPQSRVHWDFPEPPLSRSQSSGFASVPQNQHAEEPKTTQSSHHSFMGESAANVQLIFENIWQAAKSYGRQEYIEQDAAEKEASLSRSSRFLNRFLLIAAIALFIVCFAGIGSVLLFVSNMKTQQKALEATIIEQEHKRAEEFQRIHQDVQTTFSQTQERVSILQDSQTSMKLQQQDILQQQETLRQRVEDMARSFSEEKIARQNETQLLLNLTRVRINSLERRQDELEKENNKKE